jgi:hypothetical protein
MRSSSIDVGVRGEHEMNFEPEPGVSSYDPNEVVANLRNLSFQKLLPRSQQEPTKCYSSYKALGAGKTAIR